MPALRKVVDTYHPLYSSMLGAAGGNAMTVDNSIGEWRVVNQQTGATVRDFVSGAGLDFNSVRIDPTGTYVYGRNGANIVRVLISDGSFATVGTAASAIDAFGGGEGDFNRAGTRLPYLRSSSTILGIYEIPTDTFIELDVSSHTSTDACALSASGRHMQLLDDTDFHVLFSESAGTLTEESGTMAPAVGHNTTSASWPDGTDCMVTTTIAWPVDGVTNYNSGSSEPPLHYVCACNMFPPTPTTWFDSGGANSDYKILLEPPDIGWGDSVLIHGLGQDVIVTAYNGSRFMVFLCNTDGRQARKLIDEPDLSPWTYWESGFGSLDAERKNVLFSYNNEDASALALYNHPLFTAGQPRRRLVGTARARPGR